MDVFTGMITAQHVDSCLSALFSPVWCTRGHTLENQPISKQLVNQPISNQLVNKSGEISLFRVSLYNSQRRKTTYQTRNKQLNH